MSTLNPDLSKPTCRVCLQNNLDDQRCSIFDLDGDVHDLHIYEKIEQCAEIKILQHEQMPTLICGDCYGILKVSYKFRTICRNSNEYLNEILAVGKATTMLEEGASNPFSISSDKTNKQEIIRNTYETMLEEGSTPLLKNIKKEKSSPTYTELNFAADHIEDNFADEQVDKVWKDEEYLSSSESIKAPVKKLDVAVEEEIENSQSNKKCIKRRKKSKTSPPKPIEISSDGAAIIQEKKPRKKREKQKQPHACNVCGKKYELRYALERHMRRHSDEKPYECEICAHAFHCNFELVRHMRKHTGERPYKCSYCSRDFGDPSTLLKHERLHRNERPFKCDTCGKTFTYSDALKHHILTHTGEKPYACELCGKCFARTHHLRSHLDTLQHQNDPRTKELLQNIRRNNISDTSKVQ